MGSSSFGIPFLPPLPLPLPPFVDIIDEDGYRKTTGAIYTKDVNDDDDDEEEEEEVEDAARRRDDMGMLSVGRRRRRRSSRWSILSRDDDVDDEAGKEAATKMSTSSTDASNMEAIIAWDADLIVDDLM